MRKLEKYAKQFLIENPLLKFKKFNTNVTPIEDIRILLKLLYPLSCDIPLIRLGAQNDGGYLIPDDLVGISACFSPGVSSISDFEKDCANLGIEVFLADRSVNGPAVKDKSFHFTKKFIGSFSNEEFMRIDDWVLSSLPNNSDDLMLQMDIESFEYETIISMSEEIQKRFRIMVIEFHQLDQLWNRPFSTLAIRAFKKLLQTHKCVHIHPNNIANTQTLNGIEIVTTMEFTFFRKDRIQNERLRNVFPHSLDADNCTKYPSKILSKDWYQINQSMLIE